MKLKLSDMASIAEVIGAVAIVISLMYVGVQLNDSTRAVRSASANETSAAISSWYTQIGSNSQASQVFIDGITSPESLSREEMIQFIFMVHGIFIEYQSAYYPAQEGTLDAGLQESFTATLLGVREMPGFALYWKQRGNYFKPDFKSYVDDLLATGDTNTSGEAVYQPREPGR